MVKNYLEPRVKEKNNEEIKTIIKKFADAAERTRDAGFSAVELVANSGYLISEFMSSVTNKRTDRYGGDALGRATFLVEIIRAVRERVGKDFPISCKLSVDELMGIENTIEDSKVIARKAEEAGASIIHCWAGWHESPAPMLPMSVPRGAFVYLAEAIKEHDAGIVLLGATAMGKDLAPRVAVKLSAALATDSISVDWKDGELRIVRPMYAGKVRATIKLTADIKIITVRPNVYLAAEKPVDPDFSVQQVTAPEPRAVVTEVIAGSKDKLDVTEADSAGFTIVATQAVSIIEPAVCFLWCFVSFLLLGGRSWQGVNGQVASEQGHTGQRRQRPTPSFLHVQPPRYVVRVGTLSR